MNLDPEGLFRLLKKQGNLVAKGADTLYDNEIDGMVFLSMKEHEFRKIGLSFGVSKSLLIFQRTLRCSYSPGLRRQDANLVPSYRGFSYSSWEVPIVRPNRRPMHVHQSRTRITRRVIQPQYRRGHGRQDYACTCSRSNNGLPHYTAPAAGESPRTDTLGSLTSTNSSMYQAERDWSLRDTSRCTVAQPERYKGSECSGTQLFGRPSTHVKPFKQERAEIFELTPDGREDEPEGTETKSENFTPEIQFDSYSSENLIIPETSMMEASVCVSEEGKRESNDVRPSVWTSEEKGETDSTEPLFEFLDFDKIFDAPSGKKKFIISLPKGSADTLFSHFTKNNFEKLIELETLFNCKCAVTKNNRGESTIVIESLLEDQIQQCAHEISAISLRMSRNTSAENFETTLPKQSDPLTFSIGKSTTTQPRRLKPNTVNIIENEGCWIFEQTPLNIVENPYEMSDSKFIFEILTPLELGERSFKFFRATHWGAIRTIGVDERSYIRMEPKHIDFQYVYTIVIKSREADTLRRAAERVLDVLNRMFKPNGEQ